MKKYGKMIIALTLAVVLSLCDVCAFGGASVQAAGKSKKSSKKWAAAYMKTIKKCRKKDPKATYDLIYFNSDSIPELVVGIDGYWTSMYTYNKKNKKVYTLMDHWAYGAMGNAGYQYIAKKNFLHNINSDYAGAVVYTNCMKMKKNKLVMCYPKELKCLYFKDKNKNGAPDAGEAYTSSPTYYYGNKKITKKKYNSYIKSGKLKWIQGKMSYKKMKNKLSKLS